MHHGKSERVADSVIAPDLVEADLVRHAQPLSDICRPRRHVQIKPGPDLAEVGPLRHRLEVVDRLAGLDFDDAFELPGPSWNREHEVWAHHHARHLDGRRLVGADVDGHFEPPAPPRRQVLNHAVVLKLLAYGAQENRTHLASTKAGVHANIPVS